MGVLYLVATPIGNLEDITLRALRTLREVSLIAAEDTRHSGKLLKHYGIQTRMLSYHEHSSLERQGEILAALETSDVALISDAGMPGISDPGFELVRAAVERGIRIEPVPGPSAVTAAVAVSGLVPEGYLYLGFPPRRTQDRRALFESLATLPYPLILYEAPHRLTKTLGDLQATLGDRQLVLCRELTKLHEEVVRTTIAAAHESFHAAAPRGEFVLVVAAPEQIALPPDEGAIETLLQEQLAAGNPPSRAAKEVARHVGLPRSELYRLAIRLQEQSAASNPIGTPSRDSTERRTREEWQ